MASHICFNIVALFLFIYRSSAVINVQRTPPFGALNFKKLTGQYLNVSAVATVEVKNFISCAGECRKNKTCLSFNLEKIGDKTLCEILQDDYCTNKDKMAMSSKREHYYIKTPCCSGDCLNGGKCSNSYNAVKQICSCADGYGGPRCENEVKRQYCNLYSDVDKLGETVYVTSPNTDLGVQKFNDKTRSVSCYGIWILYAGAFSTYSHNFLVESKGERLINLGAPIIGHVSTIRPVGPLIEPFKKDWLVLYSRPQQFGVELLIEENVAGLSSGLHDDAESLIMHGTSSWTLYQDGNYAGKSVCIKGRSDGNLKNYWSLAEYHFENIVSSVKKGCHSSVVI